MSWLFCLSGLRRGHRPWGGVGRGSWLSLLLSVLMGFGILQAAPIYAGGCGIQPAALALLGQCPRACG